jgi:hypothetical protein
MADTQEAVRRLSIQATTSGLTDATKQLNDLAKAQGGVAVASSTTEKATLSLDQKFASIERRYVAQVRAQQDYEKVQRQVNAAVSQNPALQERANAVLAAAKDRHDQLAGSQKALGVITGDLNGRLQAQAGSFGIVGSALTALGPGGLAAAAAIGAVATAFYAASAGAHELAAKSRELKDFSEATGLTVNQVQALRSEATKFGVDSDTLQAGLQKFTTGFQDLRLGTGDLLTQVRRINPALADQMAVATDTATAFTLYGRAVAQTTNIFERNALARAGMGKGGPTIAEFLGKVGDVNALAAAYDAAGKGLQKNMIDKLAELELQISKTTSKAHENFSSIFAQPVLDAELKFANGMLKISEYAKGFTLSSDFRKFIDIVTNPVFAGIIGGSIVGAAGGALFGGVGAIPGAIAGGIAGGVAGATVNGVASLGEGKNPFFSLPAVSGNPIGAVTSAPLPPIASPAAAGGETPESLAARWKNYVSVLGTAATPTERLNAAIAELGIKAKESGQGADVLSRGIAGLKLDDAIARQNAHNAALGAAASVTDLVAAKTLELTKAQQQGAGLTQAQIENQKRLTAENALGITQIKASADGYNTEAATIGMSVGAAVEYTAVQNRLNLAKRNGEIITQDNIDKITREAQAMGRAAQNLDTMRFSYDTVSNAAVSFGQNLRNGMGAWDAFKNAGVTALGTIADKLTKMATDNLWQAAFGGSSAGGIGGLFSSIFGGGSGAAAQSASAATLAGNTGGAFFGPGFANGGTLSGGWGKVGERGPELINVHSGGVTVIPNHISKAILPGFADGGMLSPNGNVRRLPFGQDNGPAMNFTFAPVIDARGADAAAVARIANVVAKQQRDFERNVQAVVGKTRQNRPGAFG